MSRATNLLRSAADCYEEAADPFNIEWLSEHRVTADECLDLSTGIAVAIRVYLEVISDLERPLTRNNARRILLSATLGENAPEPVRRHLEMLTFGNLAGPQPAKAKE